MEHQNSDTALSDQNSVVQEVETDKTAVNEPAEVTPAADKVEANDTVEQTVERPVKEEVKLSPAAADDASESSISLQPSAMLSMLFREPPKELQVKQESNSTSNNVLASLLRTEQDVDIDLKTPASGESETSVNSTPTIMPSLFMSNNLPVSPSSLTTPVSTSSVLFSPLINGTSVNNSEATSASAVDTSPQMHPADRGDSQPSAKRRRGGTRNESGRPFDSNNLNSNISPEERSKLQQQLKEVTDNIYAVTRGSNVELQVKTSILERIKEQKLKAIDKHSRMKIRSITQEAEAEKKRVLDQHNTDVVYLREILLNDLMDRQRKLEEELDPGCHSQHHGRGHYSDHQPSATRSRTRRRFGVEGIDGTEPATDMPAYNLDYTTQAIDLSTIQKKRTSLIPFGLRKALNITLMLKQEEIAHDLMIIKTAKRPLYLKTEMDSLSPAAVAASCTAANNKK